MDFRWAITQLMDGNKIVQYCWGNNYEHYYFLGDSYIESSKYGKITLNRSHITATDWTLFAEPKNTLSDKTFYDNYGNEAVRVKNIKKFINDVKSLIGEENDNIIYRIRMFNKIDKLVGNKFEK